MAKNLVLAVNINNVHANFLSLFLQDHNNAVCIGLYEEKILMWLNGNLLVSKLLINKRCKHTTEEHNFNYPLKCKKCSCYNFDSNFACLTCDGLWEHH